MYDNYSIDNSVEIAKQHNIEVRTFGRIGILDDQHYLDVKNHCWKEQRDKGIDYVIIVDADEFVTISHKLTCTAPTVFGFNMISDNLPVDDIEKEINTGAPSESYSKQAIFSPDAIQEINYVHGCHRNNKIGKITNHDVCKLYHYRQIGGVQRMLDRHADYRKRMSDFNLKHGMGIHYLHTDEQKINEWNILKSNSVKLW